MAASGVELATAYVAVTLSMRGVEKSIADGLSPAEPAVAKTGKSWGASLGSGLKAGAAAAGGAVAAVLGTALVKGFGRLSAIEEARASLSGLGNDAGKVDAIMQNALAAVKGTAFGMDEAAQTAAGAVAAGIKPGKDLEGVLRLVGDAATIGKTSMADMGGIFNKVATSGKVQGDVLAQLSDKGIPIVQLLAKELGVTAEETVALASKGKINFETFRAAMEAGMGGAALKSGETTKGAFKNMMAAVSRLGAGLLKGVYPLFGKVFNGAGKMVDSLEAKLTPLATLFSTELAGGITAFGAAWTANDGDITSSGFPGFMERVAYIARGVFDELRGGITAFGAAWAYNDGEVTSSGFPGFMERVAYVSHQVWDSLKQLDFSSWTNFTGSLDKAGGTAGNAIAGIGSSLTTLGPAFSEFGRQLPNITGAFVKLGGVSLNVLMVALGFLADHVDTIIAWMPVIVAGFIAWRIASTALAVSQYKLQVAQAAMAPVLLANNILRFASVRAETALSIAQGQSTATTNASSAATLRAKAATVMHTVATWATVAAQKAWTVAKIAGGIAARGLGLALKFAMGPIGLVITAISLLVGGLVWFFTQTDLGKGIVQSAFAAIKTAIAAVVDWWNTALVPALQAVGQWFKDVWDGAARAVEASMVWIMQAAGNVATFFDAYVMQPIQIILTALGAAFTWLYEAIIKPVFDAISVVVNGFYLVFRAIFQLVVAVFQQIIAPAFMDFWQGVIAPVFAAAGAIISTWWNLTKAVFDIAVAFVRDTLGAIFTWLRDFIITPVFNFIRTAVSVWWAATKLIFDATVSFVRDTLGAIFTWFRDTIITPVFAGIKLAIDFWWVSVSAIFNAVVGFLRNTLGVAFTWLKDTIINPVFNGIRDTIDSVWKNGIKPVFDTLSGAVRDDLPKAFEKGKEAIKKIWDGVQEIAKIPIRFVLKDVIDGGLIGGFNKIANILKIDELPTVTPAGFRDGGYTGRVDRNRIAGVVHGDEHVIRSESRRSIEGAAPGLLESFNQLGARALDTFGFRKGGRVNPTKNMTLTQGFSAYHDGIDIGVGVGTPVFAADAGRITHAGWGASAPGVSGGKEVHLMSDGVEQWFAHLSQIGVQVGQQVAAGQQIALSGNTGISSGPHLHFGTYRGGWPNAINPLSYLAGAQSPEGGTAGGGDGGSGFLDPFGALMSLADGVLQKVKDAIPGGGFMVEAAAGIGKKLITDVIGWGKRKLGMGGVTGAPTLFDGGGWLENTGGPQLIDHRSRKPDAVLTSDQFSDIHSLAMSGGGQIDVDMLGAAVARALDGATFDFGNVGGLANSVAATMNTSSRRSVSRG